jgi:type IV secretory pathway TrbF-like protein
VIDRDKTQVYYAGTVKPVSMDDRTWDEIRVQQLNRFIEAWRTVTSDTQAQNADWDRAYHFLGDNSSARAALDKWYEEHNPVARAAAGELVTVKYKTYDREGSNTYGIWWEETTTTANGQATSVKNYRARIVYTMQVPKNENARRDNPLGVLGIELTWEEI